MGETDIVRADWRCFGTVGCGDKKRGYQTKGFEFVFLLRIFVPPYQYRQPEFPDEFILLRFVL